MNNKNGVMAKIVNFAEDKGFYIILMLCIIAIGISGYVLFFLPEAEEDIGISLDAGLEPGLPSSDVIVPDYHPEIPDVTVQLEPEKDKPVSSQAEVPAAQDNQTEDTPGEEAEETWLFKKNPEYLMPVSGEVIKEFSIDALIYDKTMDDWRAHNGIDISCTEGDPVLAIADGAVKSVYEDQLLGTVVVLSHDDGIESVYCGLALNETMAEGMEVKGGEAIGTAGNTNKTESLMESHVHLSVLKDGGYIDPQSLKLK